MSQDGPNIFLDSQMAKIRTNVVKYLHESKERIESKKN